MDIKTQFDTNLNEMAKIINQRQDSQNVLEFSPMYLVEENGMVNEKARSRLAALVNEMQNLNEHLGENQPQCVTKTSSVSKASASQPDQQDASSMEGSPTKVTCNESTDHPYLGAIPVVGPRFFPKKVQILISVQTPTTKSFSSAIATLCKDMSFKCIICYTLRDLCDKYPLAVVCPVSSRLEPDVDHTLNGIEWQNPFVVLLLHSGLESSLPRLPSSTKLANRDKFKNISFIDMAYNLDSKLHPCKMNENAQSQLQTFFTRFYKK